MPTELVKPGNGKNKETKKPAKKKIELPKRGSRTNDNKKKRPK